MASMEQTNAKKGIWLVRTRTGKVAARGLSLSEAEQFLRELQIEEDFEEAMDAAKLDDF